MLKRSWKYFAVAACVLAVACNSGKAPAEAALKLADEAVNGARAEAERLVPDDFKSLSDDLAAAKDAFAKGDYKGALAAATVDPAEGQRRAGQGQGEEGRAHGPVELARRRACRRWSRPSRAGSTSSPSRRSSRRAWTRRSWRPPRTGSRPPRTAGPRRRPRRLRATGRKRSPRPTRSRPRRPRSWVSSGWTRPEAPPAVEVASLRFGSSKGPLPRALFLLEREDAWGQTCISGLRSRPLGVPEMHVRPRLLLPLDRGRAAST